MPKTKDNESFTSEPEYDDETFTSGEEDNYDVPKKRRSPERNSDGEFELEKRERKQEQILETESEEGYNGNF